MAAAVTLIAGPTRPSKTTALLGEYRESLQTGPSLITLPANLWICPNLMSASQIRDALAASSDAAILQPGVMTFASFAEIVISRANRPIVPISVVQKQRLLQTVISSLQDAEHLEHFGPIAATPGFIYQAGRLISELKRRDVWPEQFLERCQTPRDQQLGLIYERYQQELLQHNLHDAEGRFWAARDYLKDSPDTFRFDRIVLDRFSDFTEAQLDILEKLGQLSSTLQISLDIDGQSLDSTEPEYRATLFAKPRATWERLAQIFPNLTVLAPPATPHTNLTFEHLQQNLFSEPCSPAPFKHEIKGLETLAANSPRGEIEELARRIKSLLLSGRAKPHEITIVFARPDEAAAKLSEVFSDYGIPFSLESGRRLIDSPLVRTLRTLLRLVTEDWPYHQLLRVVNNRLLGFLDDTDRNEPLAALTIRSALEASIRAAQIPSGKRPLLAQLHTWADETEHSSLPSEFHTKVCLALRGLEQLDSLLDALPAEASLDGWIKSLATLFQAAQILPADPSPTADQTSPDSSDWKALRRCLNSVAQVDGRLADNLPQLSIGELLDLIESVTRQQALSATADDVGRVCVLTPETGRYVSTSYLFLAGLDEQSFSGADRNGLLSQGESGRLLPPPVTASGLSESEFHAAEAMYLFYELVTRPTLGLTLSYAALDSKGQTLPPSPLLTELERCFPGQSLPKTTMPLGVDLGEQRPPLSQTENRRHGVALALDNDAKPLAGLVQTPSQSPVGHSILAGIGCLAQRSSRDEFTSFEGILSSETARVALGKRFGDHHLWSPSQLESYAACPFRFFAEQVLSLEPQEDLVLRSDLRRRGSLLHQVLATLHQHLRADHPTPSSDESFQRELIGRFQQALDEAIASAPLSGLQQALREIERREIEAWADRYAEQEIDYRKQWEHLDEPPQPTHFEVRFGSPVRTTESETPTTVSSALPFQLDLGHEQIRLTGQIDRVDVGRAGSVSVFNIIDYKTGKRAKVELDKVRSGHQLQLPLYALAAEKLLLAESSSQALASGYWSIPGKGFASGRSGPLRMLELSEDTLQTSQEWKQLQPAMLGRIRQIVDGIRDGQFPVSNEDQHCTQSCSFSTTCRVAQIRSLEKQWTSHAPTS